MNPVLNGLRKDQYSSFESDSEEDSNDEASIIFNNKDPKCDYSKLKDIDRKTILDLNYNKFHNIL